MCGNVEQLLRERCPRISEEFLPDLLGKLHKHDIDASMLLAGELTDEDLQAIGVHQLGVRKKLLKAFGAPDFTAAAPGAPAQQSERWDWAQPPQLRHGSQPAFAQRHTIHPSSAAQAQAAAAPASAAAPAAPAASPGAAAPTAQPKVRRRAIMPPPSSPPDMDPVFARVHERRLKANAAAHARQQAAEQQQQQQQQQGHLPPQAIQPDQRLQPPVPAQVRPQPVVASTQGTRAGSEGSGNEDGATQPKKPRRTASSLSAKEAKELQSQRETEIIALVEAYSWAQLKWAQLTNVGSDSSKALQKAVKGLARRYTGIDGRNRDEREKLYLDRFRLAHKRARHRITAAAGPSQQQPAGRASSGTPPQEAMLTPGNLLHVHSQPVAVKREAVAAGPPGAPGGQ